MAVLLALQKLERDRVAQVHWKQVKLCLNQPEYLGLSEGIYHPSRKGVWIGINAKMKGKGKGSFL